MALSAEDRAAIVGAIQEGFAGVSIPSPETQRPTRPVSTNTGSSFGANAEALGGAFGELTGTISRAGGTLQEFVTDTGSLAGRLIPGVDALGNTLGAGIGFLESTNTVFQNLSKVGAGFNGDLGALRAGAAATRMPLDAFANMVGRNAEAMAGLGAGVNQGARRFTDLSRAMFEDGEIISGMMNLGYTIEEANEALLDNANLLGRQAILRDMSEDEVARATLAMAKDMAVMAELTGKSAEQQRQELIDANRDGRNIAALRALEAQGITNAQLGFDTAFTGMQGMGDEARAYLQDMIRGQGPMSELTENFASANPVTARYVREMARVTRSQMSDEEKQRRIRELAAQAQAAAAQEYTSQSNLQAAALADVTGSYGETQASLISQNEMTNRAIMAQRAEMEAALGREVSMSEARLALEQKLRDNVNAQAGGNADNQDLSRELNRATLGLANNAASVMNNISRNMAANTAFTDLATSTLRGLTGLNTVLTGGINAAIDAGSDAAGGLNNNLETSQFTSLFDPIVDANGMLTRISNLGDVVDAINRGAGGPGLDQATRDRLNNIFGQDPIPRANGGPITPNSLYTVGEEGPELFMSRLAGSIIPNDVFTAGVQNLKNANISSMTQNLMDSLSSILPQQGESRDIMNQMQTTLSQATPNMSTDNMERLLTDLNQSMQQLIRINTQQTKISRSTVNAISGASNLMNGVAIR